MLLIYRSKIGNSINIYNITGIFLIENDINKLVLVVSGNDLLLSKLMNGYLKYNVSDELESKQITDYFNNPLEKDKLININKKTLKMKGELY